MKKLFLGLLAVGMISSSLFGYSIKYKSDVGGSSQSHTWNFTLSCNNGNTGYVTLSKFLYDTPTYSATGDGGNYWHNGTDADNVFDKAARDACSE